MNREVVVGKRTSTQNSLKFLKHKTKKNRKLKIQTKIYKNFNNKKQQKLGRGRKVGGSILSKYIRGYCSL